MLEDARKFIARVIALPEDGEKAFIGIHYSFKPKDHPKDDKLPHGGKIAFDPDDAVLKIAQVLAMATTRDVYVCMGTQRDYEVKKNKMGVEFYKPIKTKENILRRKCIPIDVDFKGGDHGYDTQKKAEEALTKFLADAGLPEPSLINHTGGGFHVYWVLSTPLSVPEWEPLAKKMADAIRQHGLKCDIGCTTDSSRILRVPNTKNHKYKGTPQVKIHKWTDRDYTPEEMAKALEKYSVVTPITVGSRVNQTVDVSALIGSKPFIRFQSTDEMLEMQAGIGHPPVEVQDLRKVCAFVDDALTTGGASLSGQPAWNMATLMSVFTVQGRQAAHDMAKSNQYYNPTDQDKIYDRKEAERARGVGWPSCAQVKEAGSTKCDTCMHFHKKKYPFSFLTPEVATQVPLPILTIPAAQDTIPDPYRRDQFGLVYRADKDDEGDEDLYFPSDSTVMRDGSLSDNPFTLHFTAVVAPHTPPREVSVQVKDIGNAIISNAMHDTLTNASVKVSNRKEMGRFLMAWTDKLKASKEHYSVYPSYGWAQNDAKKVIGFAYSSKVHTPTDVLSAGRRDNDITAQYTPRGDINEWRKASTLVTNTKRPALDAVLASAFAAPLVLFTGEQGLYFSVYSEASGIGKTTAMRLATSVWSDPNSSMHSTNDTPGSVQHKMGIIRNLPIVWDELKGDDSLRKMAGMIFQHMQGKERHRLKADITQREAGQWATMLVTASNDSLSDYLNDLAKGNEAGSYRLFELAASNAHVGIVSTAEAATSKSAVNENYGVAGLLYAQFLGTRFEMVRKIVLTTMEKFQKEANTNEAERFWLCTPVCLYLGAQFANMLGLTNIDVPALKDALLAQTDSMRTVMAETPKTISANIGELLCAYLSEHHKKTIWTNDIWNNPNRPIRGMIKVNHPMKMEVMDGPVVQIGEKTNTLRISSLSLYDWLDRRKISRTQFSAALKIMLGADLIRNKSIGSGVAGVASVPTSVFDIDCVKASAALGPMFVQAIDPTSNVIQGNFGKQP